MSGDFSSSPSSAISGVALMSGGMAGLSVDLLLFPLDTIKTRMQSSGGLLSRGGFRGLYSGLGPVALCSAPSAAIFFASYEKFKEILQQRQYSPMAVYGISSSLAEFTACTLIRVPMENVKQKVQAGLFPTSRLAFHNIFKQFGMRGFYIGYQTTLMRDIPFTWIQFSLYEKMKILTGANEKKNPLIFPVLGSISGSIAAALTCPLDVLKTRLMTQTPSSRDSLLSPIATARLLYLEGGLMKFFSGLTPRVLWISIGGAIFFGSYENYRLFLLKFQKSSHNGK